MLCATLFTYGQNRDSIFSEEQLSSASIFLFANDSSQKFGTGTLIQANGAYFILTASHVAKHMNDNTLLILRDPGDKPYKVKMTDLLKGNKVEWLHHSEADLAVLSIFPPSDRFQKFVDKWAFPMGQVYVGEECLERGAEVTYFGYPLLDQKLEYFSPILFRSLISSGFLTQPRGDIEKSTRFFFLDEPSMQGSSGSAVFVTVRKAFGMSQMIGNQTLLIGVIHGTSQDTTGGKLAMVTPAFFLTSFEDQ